MSADPPTPPDGVTWGAAKPPRFYLRGHLAIHAVALVVIGLHMAAYGAGYQREVWKGLLYIDTWASPATWATVFLTLAVLKGVAAWRFPRFSIVALLGGILVFTWLSVGLWFAVLDPPAGVSPPAVIPAVLASLTVGEHYVALTLIDRSRSRGWKARWIDGG